MSDLGFIHRYVPPREGGDRTLLLLHGTGGNEEDLLSFGAELDPEAGLLSPRGKVLENGMPRFFRRLAEGVFDEEDLRFRAHELANFVLAAAQKYHFDANHVIAVGFSNGANIAASLLLLYPSVLSGAALLHAMVPLVPEIDPNLANKPIFLSASENDPIVPISQSIRLQQMLSTYGAQVTTATFRNGHRISSPEVKALDQWVKSL